MAAEARGAPRRVLESDVLGRLSVARYGPEPGGCMGTTLVAGEGETAE